MKLKLISFPDCKSVKLTLDKTYEIRGTVGNGYLVQADDFKSIILVLQNRFMGP